MRRLDRFNDDTTVLHGQPNPKYMAAIRFTLSIPYFADISYRNRPFTFELDDTPVTDSIRESAVLKGMTKCRE
jgi:hypothetical protein